MANNQYTNPYTSEEIEFIKTNYDTMSYRTLADKLNELFHHNRTEKAVSSYTTKILGLYKSKTLLSHSRNVYDYKLLTKDELNYIENNYKKYPIPELVKKLNKKFGNNRPPTTIYAVCRRNGYKYPKHYKFYTKKEQEWIRTNIQTMDSKTLTDTFNKLFHHNKRWDAIKSYCNRILGINFNKEITRKTAGKNRQLPIGTEVLSKDHYVKVKIADTYKGESKNWKLKHYLIWEKHYGPIPKGTNVIFLDGNNRNFDINNLALCDTKTLLLLNHWDYYGHHPSITKAGIAVCETHLKLLKKQS